MPEYRLQLHPLRCVALPSLTVRQPFIADHMGTFVIGRMGFGVWTVVGFGVVMDSCHFLVSWCDRLVSFALESNPIKRLLLGSCLATLLPS